MSTTMSPDVLRDLIATGEVDTRDQTAVAITIEQLENALHVVLDELDCPVNGDSSIVVMNRYRVAGAIADALGMRD